MEYIGCFFAYLFGMAVGTLIAFILMGILIKSIVGASIDGLDFIITRRK